jgi:hypothetical protein
MAAFDPTTLGSVSRQQAEATLTKRPRRPDSAPGPNANSVRPRRDISASTCALPIRATPGTDVVVRYEVKPTADHARIMDALVLITPLATLRVPDPGARRVACSG